MQEQPSHHDAIKSLDILPKLFESTWGDLYRNLADPNDCKDPVKRVELAKLGIQCQSEQLDQRFDIVSLLCGIMYGPIAKSYNRHSLMNIRLHTLGMDDLLSNGTDRGLMNPVLSVHLSIYHSLSLLMVPVSDQNAARLA